MFPVPPVLGCPPPAETGITVELLRTGSVPGDWRRVVDTGEAGPVELPVWVGVIRHPAHGVTLVDAGLGARNRTGEEPHFPFNKLPLIVPDGATALEQLGAPPERVLLTHIHYDHIGGLYDMPGTEVWLSTVDAAAAATETGAFHTRALRDIVRLQPVDFTGDTVVQVLGRPAVDVLGDGTVYFLSLPGHTAGSTAVLVRAEGQPYLFVGDTAWVDAHLHAAQRPLLTQLVVDANRHDLRESLTWARNIRASCPDIHIVAGHEPSPAAP